MERSLCLCLLSVFGLASSQLASNDYVLDYKLQTEVLEASFRINHPMLQQDGGVFTGDRAVNWNVSIPRHSVGNISEECQDDFDQYESDLMQGEMYALLMFDATGKPPSGILQGNMKWLGSFSGCKNITKERFNITFDAKYYLVQLALETKIPHLDSLTLGVCVPSTCSSRDVTEKLNTSIIYRFLFDRQILKTVSAQPVQYQPIQNTTIAAIWICSCLALLLLLGTMYDVVIHQPWLTSENNIHEADSVTDDKEGEKTQHNGSRELASGKVLLINTARTEIESIKEGGMAGQVLLCFSLYTNIGKLLSTKQAPGTIRCLHGIRFLSLSWVILGHTYSGSQYYADNMSTISVKEGGFASQAIRNGFVSVDSFFFMSGLLMSYLLLKQMHKSKDEGKPLSYGSYGMIYLHRYLRLTPVYLFVMMLYMWVYPYLFRGPLSPSAVPDPDCEQKWWTNMLYINNLVHFQFDKEFGCMGSSWYLANDMQFFVIGVPLVYILFRYRRLGFALQIILLLASFISTPLFYLKFSGNGVYNLTYVKPYSRIGPYLVGLAVGWLLLKTKGKINSNMTMKLLAAVCWAVAAASALAVVYGLYGTWHGTVLTKSVYAFYHTVSPTVWGLALGWVVIACFHGFGGFVDTILSWSFFVPLSRLAYCAYLVQDMVILFYYESRETPVHYTDLTMVYIFLGNLMISYGLAFLVSMAVEVPLLRLEKLVFKK